MIEAALPTVRDILFYVLAAGSIAGAILVLVQHNPITCALSLVVTLISIAGLFLTLYAHFIAFMQILIYAGAIMVLFLFVIMLLNLSVNEWGGIRFRPLKILAALVSAATLGAFGRVIYLHVHANMHLSDSPSSVDYGGIKQVGVTLFTEYLVPFELASVLILAAMVGAVVLSKQNLQPQKSHSLLDWLLDRAR